MMTEVANSERVALDRRRRIDSGLDQASKLAQTGASDLRRQCSEALEQLSELIRSDLRTGLTALDSEVRNVISDFERSDLRDLAQDEIESLQTELEGRIRNAGEHTTERFGKLREQLQALVEALREGVSMTDVTAAVEEQSEAYREELDVYLEWAQVGMALGIIQHEFTGTIQSIRTGIRQLKPWADGTPALKNLYQTLQAGFEHLDEYLSLFNPLRRRLYRTKVPLTGEEIRRYLAEVFGSRLERHEIKMKATAAFDRKSITVFPSTFLPCFVNLIDNAIYWLSTARDLPRDIRLDADEEGFIVENTGPGIERRMAERIFEFGVSLKPTGRGMGLSISRDALRREGYDLKLETPAADNYPRFRIAPMTSQSTQGEK
jgi:signal transduction histidine kinase